MYIISKIILYCCLCKKGLADIPTMFQVYAPCHSDIEMIRQTEGFGHLMPFGNDSLVLSANYRSGCDVWLQHNSSRYTQIGYVG